MSTYQLPICINKSRKMSPFASISNYLKRILATLQTSRLFICQIKELKKIEIQTVTDQEH